MRGLFPILALLGVAGIVLGILNIIRHASGPHGVSFGYENNGGPGPIIAGVVIIAVSLYLRSFWKTRE